MDISPWAIEKATGKQCTLGLLTLANCPMSGVGHSQCGWCGEHQLPRARCPCINTKDNGYRYESGYTTTQWDQWFVNLAEPVMKRYLEERKCRNQDR